jgi:predicted N-acyltransferase
MGGDSNQVVNINLKHSITEVDSLQWNEVVNGKGLFLSIPYLKAVEESNISGLSFRYAILEKARKPLAVFLFQAVDLSFEGVGGILNLDNYGGISAAVANSVNALLFKKGDSEKPIFLVCGSLLASGEYGMVGVDSSALSEASKYYPHVLKQVKSTLGDVRVVAEMAKDFYESSEHAIQVNKSDFGTSLRTDPEMILDLNPEWKNFEDYLAALGSKYRVRANGVRKSLDGLIVRKLDLAAIESNKTELQELFSAVSDRAPIRIVKPQMDYLISLKRHLKEDMSLTAFYLDGRIVAFRTALVGDQQLEAHYIGMDYGLNKDLCLYQNILYGLIEDGIRSKVSRVMFGRTALEIKSTVGARPYKLACYIRFRNRTLNTVVKVLSVGLGPKEWIPRSPFK